MTQDESYILKGMSILLMLFHHLFLRPDFNDLYTSYFFIEDTPLCQVLTIVTNPVQFFCFLSGYGLYFIWCNIGRDSKRIKRLVKLYSRWWVSLLCFTLIGSSFYDLSYNNSLEWIKNLTGYHTTYYAEAWFLIPYVMLSLVSSYLFSLIKRIRTSFILCEFFILGLCTSFIFSRYGDFFYGKMVLYNLFLVLHISPAFIFGAMVCRTDFISRLKKSFNPTYCGWLILVLLIIISIWIRHTAAWSPLYCSLFIIIFLFSKRSEITNKILFF